MKYKEDYEKFKSLYSLPKSLEDDPATARCIKAGKLVLDVSLKQIHNSACLLVNKGAVRCQFSSVFTNK